MHLFIFLLKNYTICTKRQVLWAAVKPNASQWDAMLHDDVGFLTVYRRIYLRKFLTLPNQTSRYIRKCIRIIFIFFCRWKCWPNNSIPHSKLKPSEPVVTKYPTADSCDTANPTTTPSCCSIRKLNPSDRSPIPTAPARKWDSVYSGKVSLSSGRLSTRNI